MSEEQSLFEAAREVLAKAYAPYSKFVVAAALLDEHNLMHVGVNIENASYPCGVCAEATAISKMVTTGSRKIRKLLVMCDANISQDLCTPCGLCRQRIREFAAEDLVIILSNSEKILKTVTLGDLLPLSFGPENLNNMST